MIQKKIEAATKNLLALRKDEGFVKNIQQAAEWSIHALKTGNKLLICGNGGSAAEAQHFAGELVGRYYEERRPLPAIALTTDSSILTAVANDYSYEEVFSRQVIALGQPGDILYGFSTSGASRNVLKAFQAARERNLKTILLSGAKEKEIASLSHLVIKTPSTDTPRIQEMHLLAIHLISEIIENAFFNRS